MVFEIKGTKYYYSDAEAREILSARPAMALHMDRLEEVDNMTDEEAGWLFKAIIDFNRTGNVASTNDRYMRSCLNNLVNGARILDTEYVKTTGKNRLNSGAKNAPCVYDPDKIAKETSGTPKEASGIPVETSGSHKDKDTDTYTYTDRERYTERTQTDISDRDKKTGTDNSTLSKLYTGEKPKVYCNERDIQQYIDAMKYKGVDAGYIMSRCGENIIHNPYWQTVVERIAKGDKE